MVKQIPLQARPGFKSILGNAGDKRGRLVGGERVHIGYPELLKKPTELVGDRVRRRGLILLIDLGVDFFTSGRVFGFKKFFVEFIYPVEVKSRVEASRSSWPNGPTV